MTKEEIFAKFDALITETRITEKELQEWFQSRQQQSTSTKAIKTPFPIAYKKGNKFEILPEFIPERRNEVWGYEIMPKIIIAKECGPVGNVKVHSWYNAKEFSIGCVLEGKEGYLPSMDYIEQRWTKELPSHIKVMDKFLRNNGVDAEEVHCGLIWCSETYGCRNACYFNLDSGIAYWGTRYNFGSMRLVVAF